MIRSRIAAVLSMFSMVLIAGCQEAADVARWDPRMEEPTPAGLAEQPKQTALPAMEAEIEISATSVFVWDEFVEEIPPPTAASFPILDVGNLYFYVFLKDLDPGEHVARLDVVGPDEYRYTTLSAVFEVPEEELAPMGTRAVMELPIAGTHISRFLLTGVWTARLLLDVVAGPALHTSTFELYGEQPEG